MNASKPPIPDASRYHSYRSMLVRLSDEVADGLVDLQYRLQRERRTRVTKRALIEQALKDFLAQSGK